MAHPAELNWQRLPLTGADNVRDLGGYPVGLRQTKWHAFLRAGKLSRMSRTKTANSSTATVCAWSSTCAPRRGRVCT
jgi:hypothetical protein